jgi:hypothetical protein
VRLRILKNVKVYVSKKLVKQQSVLCPIVESLGGDFSWTYNSNCTHYIYSGKLNDNNKELKQAKEDGKQIVTPEWILACQEENRRVDEEDYLVAPGLNNKSTMNQNSIASGGITLENPQNHSENGWNIIFCFKFK